MATLNLQQRASRQQNSVGRKLFTLIEKKRSPLCVAADVTRAKDLLKLAEDVGPSICMLKTHIDILEDFSWQVIDRLLEIAERHQFLLFEDRKFSDIGNTVQMQYRDGMYRIIEWADIVDAHIFPGSGIIEGLAEIGRPKGRALLLLAEMSSAGNLFSSEITGQAVQWADRYADFVIGFIGQTVQSQNPGMLVCTPGVSGEQKGDQLGQQYRTPEEVIASGSDVVIVGRSIVRSPSPAAAAAELRERAWTTLIERLAQ